VFHVVPDSGPAGATWTKKSDTNPPSGGDVWTTFSLDPANGVLYVPTGNVGPDFALALHPGENLYTNSILALDARSGALLAYVQPINSLWWPFSLSTTASTGCGSRAARRPASSY